MPVPRTPPPDLSRLAALALAHPAALALPSTAANVLVAISDRDTGDISPTELRLLTAAEVACGQEVRP